MAQTYTLAALFAFLAAILAIQNAAASGQTLLGMPMAFVVLGVVLFWLGQKRQRVI
jgi:hypothetical protein